MDAVSQVIGYIKGKSAISIARTYMGRKQNFTGENFWAKRYYVSMVGRDEESIKEYIREQDAGHKRRRMFLPGSYRLFCASGVAAGAVPSVDAGRYGLKRIPQ
jgi:hypothetical protein